MHSYSPRNILPLAAIVWTLGIPGSRADTVTLNDGGVTDLQVVARDRTGNPGLVNDIEHLFPTSLSFNGSPTASQGASSSLATFSLSQSDFSITSTGTRAGSLDSLANVQPTLFFSVPLSTPYIITGSLSVDDPGSSGKFASLTATLIDLSSSGVLFNSIQASFGVVDQSFILGGTAGNQQNVLSGSSTGLLLPGHQYKLFFGSSIYAANSGDPASFVGSFDMKLGDQSEPGGPSASVPDGGASFWLLASSLCGLVWLRRKF